MRKWNRVLRRLRPEPWPWPSGWLRAGRDEALFASSWDVWWSDYAESQGLDDFVVGAFEDFDDHVMLGYEDESVSGDDEPGLADLADLADG